MDTTDKMTIEILPDGMIKITTDAISAPMHMSAESFLREISRLAGGEVEIETKQGHAHQHVHADNETHLNQ